MSSWERFKALFPAFTRVFGVYGIRGQLDAPDAKTNKRTVAANLRRTVKRPLTDADWQGHLEGTGDSIGLVPLLDNGHSLRWAAIDFDIYPIDMVALERDAASLPITFIYSKSRGAHGYVFFKEDADAEKVTVRLRQWAVALGAKFDVEIFPKQTKRDDPEKETGNWINMPYFGKTRRAVYQGKELTLAEFLDVAEDRLLTLKEFMAIKVEPRTELFADGPPCLQTIFAQEMFSGNRNNVLFMVGVYLKAKFPNEDWIAMTLAFNDKHFREPLPHSEINNSVLNSLPRRDYLYTCSKQPMSGCCDRPLCNKREWGIKGVAGEDTAKGGKATELTVDLTDLVMIETSPPTYTVRINGKGVTVNSTDDLIDQKRFRKHCVETARVIPPIVKDAVWEQHIQFLLDHITIQPAPFEASPEGILLAKLNAYIEARGKGTESVEVLANGQVYSDATHAHLSPTHLFDDLKRSGFRDFTVQQMYAILIRYGVTQESFLSKGRKRIQIWKLPLDKLNLQSAPHAGRDFTDPLGGPKDA